MGTNNYAGWMKSENIRTSVRGIWCWRLLDAHQMTSVLLAFSWSWLLYIHNSTSSTHTDTHSWSCNTANGWHKPFIHMSSAYRCGQSWYLSTYCSQSAIYSTNRMGRWTDPCGTPHERKVMVEEAVPWWT